MATKKDIEDIKQVMDATTDELIKKMESTKFRKKVFKQSNLFSKKEVEQAVLDWDTLKEETKREWFDSVLFKTKDENGNEDLKAYEEILMIVGLLKNNKLNLGQTWRELKTYGETKKNKNA